MSVRKQSVLYELNKNKVLYLMFIPVMAFFITFYYLPIGGIVWWDVRHQRVNSTEELSFSGVSGASAADTGDTP